VSGGGRDAVSRFTGFAAEYDAARPKPPAEVAAVIAQWCGRPRPDVVDLAAGTGLSTLIWAGSAGTVTAVEPSPDMRGILAERVSSLRYGHAGAGDTPGTAFTVTTGTAEATGLPGASADIVTASQAMHWFDPDRALPEIARVLRPGGVLAAYDCDWPPCTDWEADEAYTAFENKSRAVDVAGKTSPPRAEKSGHLGRMRASGLFRFATEIAVHSNEQGDGQRLVDVALSQGGVVTMLKAGVTEDELGLTRLREVAARRLPEPRTWWWTYRIRLAVR
jgi:SAM-dependent methyltransferase